MIGQRLKLARRAVGLSLRDLECRIDKLVTAQAISKYELDKAMPSSDVLIALADALGVSVDYLFGDPNLALEAVEFRGNKFKSKRELARIEAKVLHLLERYLTVEEILNMPSVVWDCPQEAPWPVPSDPAQAEPAAQGLRAHWGLSSDPIADLVELSEERGIKVVSAGVEQVDGLTARISHEDGRVSSVIVVNRRHGGERQRFTIAHELGHMVLDVAQNVDGEKAAQRFAGAFLMPAETLQAKIGAHRKAVSWDELFDLKRIFGVSVQALVYRCREIGIFSNALFRQFFEEFTRRGWRHPPFQEPNAMKREEPRRFRRLCFRALSEDAISEAKAAELLGISVRELNLMMDAPEVLESGLEEACT